ncbi:hypothetical protein AB0B89_36010, partial [Sphaerisporangium sp. NPDC049002]|uniref:hypothetical protein n=1 Tax=Sphaerisporangium sp. NPDC049002 TaxID=3155392 RepID=UPI0033D2DFF8
AAGIRSSSGVSRRAGPHRALGVRHAGARRGVAEHVGVPEEELEAFENDTAKPTSPELERLSIVLRTPVYQLRGNPQQPRAIVATTKRPYTEEELAEVAVLLEMTEDEFRGTLASFVRNPDRAGNRVFAHPDVIGDTAIALQWLMKDADRRLRDAKGFKKKNHHKGSVAEIKAQSERYRLNMYLKQILGLMHRRTPRHAAEEIVGTKFWQLTSKVMVDLEAGATANQAQANLEKRLREEFPQVLAVTRGSAPVKR